MTQTFQRAQSQDLTELEELLAFGFDLQDALKRTFADGKMDWSDIPNFLSLGASGKLAIQNLGNPALRFRNLPAEEREQLFAFARQRFDLSDDILEFLIEDTLQEVQDVFNLVSRWIRYARPAEDRA